MIVDSGSLDVAPVCDRLLEAVAGAPTAEVDRGAISWSNELVLHVLELKTNGPAATLEGLGAKVHAEVATANALLADISTESGRGSALLPGGAHPWMDPSRDTRLWPHEYNEVYRTFDRIFGCRGHGWSNLQSTHINLPFADDGEFARLHAAIRVVLPLIPALAASSPFLDGTPQADLDARLTAYRNNARRVPEVTGRVVPEPVRSEGQYRERILDPLYRAMESHDPEGVLRHEWLNARGAIARFERGAIEIRVIDAQECPGADIAVVSMIVALVRALTFERWADTATLDRIDTARLAALLAETTRAGSEAIVSIPELAAALGHEADAVPAGTLWRGIAERVVPDGVADDSARRVERIVAEGPLAARMMRAHADGMTIRAVAEELAQCLADDRLFRA